MFRPSSPTFHHAQALQRQADLVSQAAIALLEKAVALDRAEKALQGAIDSGAYADSLGETMDEDGFTSGDKIRWQQSRLDAAQDAYDIAWAHYTQALTQLNTLTDDEET